MEETDRVEEMENVSEKKKKQIKKSTNSEKEEEQIPGPVPTARKGRTGRGRVQNSK